MAGILNLSDADLYNLILQQHQLLQQTGATDALPPWSPDYVPGITYMPRGTPASPPLPERNPKRKAVEDYINPEWFNALELERQSRLGHSSPLYDESDYALRGQPGKKRKEMKNI